MWHQLCMALYKLSYSYYYNNNSKGYDKEVIVKWLEKAAEDLRSRWIGNDPEATAARHLPQTTRSI